MYILKNTSFLLNILPIIPFDPKIYEDFPRKLMILKDRWGRGGSFPHMFSATGLPYATISHPSAINIPRCHHIRVNGVQCGSPALKDRRLCYFHSRVRITRGSTNLPILEDINSVQHALMQVITALLEGKVDRQIGGLLLYGLQTASANSRHV